MVKVNEMHLVSFVFQFEESGSELDENVCASPSAVYPESKCVENIDWRDASRPLWGALIA